ncbi:hypothetical protein C6P46_006608 [Rhodotorula mucilaginosa]|uniref:Uncharacterized protein n=1 Tax=Rhodotorula mucilaginosa TaxID=5537 RepID=A0A9P6VWN2_RHOMI|nr:hypothetical protein C6P46_006608 [Rhodotorula mucilaginosa]TKA50787.1 hypothetical protein B0A53_06146 [Rhodotorula sp. CCFEE 5036]
MSRRDSTYFSEGQQPGGAQDGFDSSDDGLGSSMHLSPSFMGGFVQEDSRRGSNYYGSDHGALASLEPGDW